MDKNFEWFLKADLKNYEGKYVAIAGQKVVDSGKDPAKVYEKAKQEYPRKKVVLWKVPKEGTFVF